MKHIFKKYEFQDESTAQTRIDALPSVEEDGVSSPSHSHTIVKLGHVVVTEGSYDEEGKEVSAPVLASNYSVDVLWNKSELTEVDEDGNESFSFPYGWASKEITIEEGNGVHTFSGWSYVS